MTDSRGIYRDWKKDTWHKVKFIRNADTGDIAFWFDDAPAPILAARDEGRFRNLSIRGTSRAVK
jgi:hypothetical protein